MIKIKSEYTQYILIVLFIVVVIGLFYYARSRPRSESAQINLIKTEFNSIIPLPTAVLNNISYTDKYTMASVAARYSANTSRTEIVQYYSNELEKYGWYFYEETKDKDIYGNFNGWSYYYRKGRDYEVVIFYPSEEYKKRLASTYTFYINFSKGFPYKK